MRLAMLSGGVGGARLARGLAAITDVDLTVIVNVGDDERIYGLLVSPDIDTVIYTMAGREGPHGWGLRDDPFTVMAAMDALPIDTNFRIGDRDIATNLFRTDRLAGGWSLTWVTTALASAFGVPATVLPATDDPLKSQVRVADGGWISFQEYFVVRRHTDEVEDIRFEGAASSTPAPGVIEAIEASDALIIGPSNPVLSIWPILAVPAIGSAVAQKERVMAVSPLIGGSALKGPAHRVLTALGYGAGTTAVIDSYGGVLTDIVIDNSDADDAVGIRKPWIHVTDTRMPDLAASTRLAQVLVDAIGHGG
ncbi:MAG TPA: 2-phospho-L-lactate transferase [Acidimicrobiia bacterium]|nr:2-phospho-L-lactate transferase [Acidimicrobiia bacterium]